MQPRPSILRSYRNTLVIILLWPNMQADTDGGENVAGGGGFRFSLCLDN